MPRLGSSSHSTYRLSASRRDFLRAAAAAGFFAGLSRFTPVYAKSAQSTRSGPAMLGLPPALPVNDSPIADLVIDKMAFRIGDRVGEAVTVNGSLPAPLLRFRQGQEVELRVTNKLTQPASIHWHGILVPNGMDGVPGVTFKGIDPGETFTYRFTTKQSGTYWYHSHSGFQEQLGLYGPLVIDPIEPEPFTYSREYVVVLSDWTFANPERLLTKLKKQSNFSNMQQRTLVDFFDDISKKGIKQTWSDRAAWGKMRMDPTDIADLTGTYFSFLLNGRSAETPWSGIFRAGERVRLRIINSAATTHFDLRIPGLKMTVVQADGQNVKPVEVEEFRMGAAETYDVIVEPTEDRAYAIFAETTDRSGFALGALAPREGMIPPVPARRKRTLRTMADMGMAEAGMAGMAMDSSTKTKTGPGNGGMGEMDMGAASTAKSSSTMATKSASSEPDMAGMAGMGGTGSPAPAPSSPKGMTGMSGGSEKGGMKNDFGPSNSMVAMAPKSRAGEPGTGLGEDSRRVLVYRDLVALENRALAPPEREIIMNVTGNMERFIWGFEGKTYSEAKPISLRFGERVRITFINHTMMEHPLHLHGMFMELENGAEGVPPLKHTVTVKPGEKISVLVTADARGDWAFHCHLFYHMEAGMFRVFNVA